MKIKKLKVCFFVSLLIMTVVFVSGNLLGSASFAYSPESTSEELKPYVVKFKEPAGDEEKKIIESLGGKVIFNFEIGELRKWLSVEIPENAVDKLKENNNVLFVEENIEITLKTPKSSNATGEIIEVEKIYNDKKVKSIDVRQRSTLAGDTYPDYARIVGADKAHEKGITGKGVSIAHIGDGVDKDHEDLSIKAGIGLHLFLGLDEYDDDHGHGTACIGVYNMQDNDVGYIGIAPDADVYVYKISKKGEYGMTMRYDYVALAFQACAIEKHDIVQVSWGGHHRIHHYFNLFRDAVKEAYDAGCFIVCALGNDSSEPHLYPASWKDWTIGISNVDKNDNFYVHPEYGSNYGYGFVDFCAPGVLITTTNNQGGYSLWTGTSFSGPVVCGIAALYKQEFPNLDLYELIRLSAIDLGDAGYDKYYGHGRVKWIDMFPGH